MRKISKALGLLMPITILGSAAVAIVSDSWIYRLDAVILLFLTTYVMGLGITFKKSIKV